MRLVGQPVSDADHLLAPGLTGRQEHGPSQLRLPFEEHHPVSSLRGDARRLQSGRSAPDDQHPAGGRHLIEGAPFPLATDGRVVDAPHGRAVDNAVDAARAIADAWTEIAHSPCGDFAHEVGLRDGCADHRHQSSPVGARAHPLAAMGCHGARVGRSSQSVRRDPRRVPAPPARTGRDVTCLIPAASGA